MEIDDDLPLTGDVYDEEQLCDMVESDELEPWEEGFLQGWNDAG